MSRVLCIVTYAVYIITVFFISMSNYRVALLILMRIKNT